MVKMSKKQVFGIIIILLIVGIFIIILWSLNGVFGWLQNQTQEIVLALIMAIIAGLIIETVYKKLSPQSKMLKSTRTQFADVSESMAQLNLPNNNNIIVDGAEKVIGREDFLGVVSSDKLYFIGKDHFKITHENGSFYIQDLKTKNGTTVNGEQLQSSQKRQLINGDEIMVAKSLRIKYKEL